MMSNYQTLRAINVNEHTEKKGNLTYLSWAWAVDTLLQQDPLATWEYKEPISFQGTLMVFCTVTAFGKSMTAQLPVMDYKNKAIPNPDSMAVNTAMQRCLAKAIALHGLGLYIYAGEDLPEGDTVTAKPFMPALKSVQIEDFDEEEQTFLRDTAMEVIAFVADGKDKEAHDLSAKLDNDEKLAIWGLFDSKTRSAMKKYSQSLNTLKVS